MRTIQAHYHVVYPQTDYKDLQSAFAADFLNVVYDDPEDYWRKCHWAICCILEDAIAPIATKIMSSPAGEYSCEELHAMIEECDAICIDIIRDYVVPHVDEPAIFKAISSGHSAEQQDYLLFLYANAINAFFIERDKLEQRYNDYKENL